MVKKYTSAVAARFAEHGPVPSDAVAFVSKNAAAITTTTKQTIKALTAGKAIYVKKVIIDNPTVAEAFTVVLQDSTSTPVEYSQITVPVLSSGSVEYEFKPPLEVTVGKDFDGIGLVATKGDAIITAIGWVGTASAALEKGTEGDS